MYRDAARGWEKWCIYLLGRDKKLRGKTDSICSNIDTITICKRGVGVRPEMGAWVVEARPAHVGGQTQAERGRDCCRALENLTAC